MTPPHTHSLPQVIHMLMKILGTKRVLYEYYMHWGSQLLLCHVLFSRIQIVHGMLVV